LTDEQIRALKEPGGKQWEVWTAAERAVLDFTDVLTGYPAGINEADLGSLSEHFSETQIVELVLTIATANFTNRFNEGAKTPVDV
jgi:alkylhydroperoxidase family enzyme